MEHFEIRFGNPALLHEFMEEEMGKAGGAIDAETIIEEKKDGTFLLNLNQMGAYRFGYALALWQVKTGNIKQIGNLTLSVS